MLGRASPKHLLGEVAQVFLSPNVVLTQGIRRSNIPSVLVSLVGPSPDPHPALSAGRPFLL